MMSFSKRPTGFGFVSITAAARVEILLLKSSRSPRPSAPALTVTAFRGGSAVRDQDLIGLFAAAAMVPLDHAQSGPLAMCAGRRLQAHAVHRGQRQQRTLQLPHQPKRPLGPRRWVIGVEIGKVVEAGEGLVDGGGVLHRAGAGGREPV